MAGYNKIERSIWRAGAFASLTDDAKLVAFLLLTGPQAMAIPGVLVAGPGALAEELGWEVDRFKVAFQELERAGRVELIKLLEADLQRVQAENTQLLTRQARLIFERLLADAEKAGDGFVAGICRAALGQRADASAVEIGECWALCEVLITEIEARR